MKKLATKLHIGKSFSYLYGGQMLAETKVFKVTLYFRNDHVLKNSRLGRVSALSASGVSANETI